MSKEICISTTPHETRLAILENDELTEIYYERENEYTLAGSIYKGRVTRVLPGMQSAFVDLGLERDAFLYVTDFLEEQDGGADFERVGGGQQQRKEGGRDNNRENASRESGGRETGSREAGGRESGGRESRESRESRDGGRDASRSRQPQEAVAESSAEPAAADGSEDGDSPSGTRRWRGRRGRRRGFRPRGQEGTTAQSESPEAAEESAGESTRDSNRDSNRDSFRESIRESIVDEPLTLPERGAPGGTMASNRILLPGESLSRYGGAPAPGSTAEPEPQQAAAPAFKPNYVAPKPSTLIEALTEWDGGSLLPGESRARRQHAAAVETEPVQHESPIAEFEGDDIETQVDEILAEVAHTIPVSDFEMAEEDADRVAVASAFEEPVEFAVPTPSAPIEAVPDQIAQNAPEPHAQEPHAPESHAEIVTEPVALVHDQLETPVAEAHQPAVEAHPHEPVHELIEETHEFEPETASASYRIDAVAPSEFRVSSVIEEELPAAEHEAAPEAIFEEAVIHEATAPAAFEVEFEEESDSLDERNDSPQLGEPAIETDQPFGFSPGAGILEEEVIDEEEYDFEPIHAHHDEHDIEELEEETLEHSGAEIGDMVRDTHLNQRLSVEPGADEEEDEDSDELEYGEVDLDEDEEDEEGEGVERDEPNGEAVTADGAAPAREGSREGGREGERRGGRRGDRGRGRGGDRGGRSNQRRHGGGGGGRRPSAQVTDLPIISELLKQGQEILVQIAKEPIAKKGARITSHIALPGRFLVFMPTVNHVGVSRKIDSDEERQRLKRILISEKGDASGGFIVRTAADGASEEELRADLRFLISLWNDIKQREESSKAPALIYHDLNLIERVLRDQVSDNFSAIWVDSEAEYERTVRFLNRFQPSLVRRVKLYTKETPLFEQFGIQDEITKALKSKVWLKSGGSIVINQTEALVAIDINTGKYVGKTARLEDTIVKTNLDAIPEIVRQIRLRDLGGIIVIDFIDMDERKNRHKVLAALEEALKADRAPSKVLQFNDFGLVAITRKRVKQSLERTLSIPCPVCVATGMVKSPTTVANEIFVELRKMQKHLDRGDVMLRVNPEVVKTLKANNARWLNEMEEMLGKTIIVKSDPALHPEQFDIH
ncbi:ribonuclease G [Silvibacterium bohemicum]|uniref:Ribonuclease G n=1 Tax=Silvibacterium bohemicum TaxID=1577686 RepID=A0A841K0C5_9BACT|nr:Rne/Rng family ribonuclease [Silvibacterium bohemicum]MBB6146057.1 ribonuclease G [Silvibacterium bohemicum]